MITVRVYDDYISIALQAVDTNDLEGCEFSNKFEDKNSGDMNNLMGCVGHQNDPNYLKIQLVCLYMLLSRQSAWIFK